MHRQGSPLRSPLVTLLDRQHYQLIDVARRQFVMEALTKELDRVTRGETFRIANDVTWLMLLDSRDVLVIHLASWAKGVYTPGGLIGQLRADHLRRFPKQRPPEERDDSYGWRTRRDREHADSFVRLFPNVTGDHPDGAAFERLTDGFATRMKPVVTTATRTAHIRTRARERARQRCSTSPSCAPSSITATSS